MVSSSISQNQKQIQQSTPFSLSLPITNGSQKPAHVPGIKPPMLKLALKPYEDLTYEQVDMEEKNHKFDIRATARHELKMQKFSNDCSMIL